MNGGGNNPSEWSNLDSKRQTSCFLSFVDFSFVSSDIYVSFEIPKEVRKLLRGFPGWGDRKQ